MDTKTFSEVAKNWATTTALVIGTLVTLTKGCSFAEKKDEEISLRNDGLKVEAVKARLEVLREIDNSVANLKNQFHTEEMKPPGKQDDAVMDNARIKIEEQKRRELDILNEIRNTMESKIRK